MDVDSVLNDDFVGSGGGCVVERVVLMEDVIYVVVAVVVVCIGEAGDVVGRLELVLVDFEELDTELVVDNVVLVVEGFVEAVL